MKLRVDDISGQTREISFWESETEINRILDQGPIREILLAAPVQVSLAHYRSGMELFFEGKISAAACSAVCARCTEQFDTSCERAFRFVLMPKAAGYAAKDLKAEDLELSSYSGEEIDLSPLIREQVLLALPTRPLCRQDCKGLCSQCGVNLNQAQCGCEPRTADPRFAALRALKIG